MRYEIKKLVADLELAWPAKMRLLRRELQQIEYLPINRRHGAAGGVVASSGESLQP
jgi:hypothetical protein